MINKTCHALWQMLTNEVNLGSFATGYILRGYIPPDGKCPTPRQAVANDLPRDKP